MDDTIDETKPQHQSQKDLELLYSKYQLLPVLRDEFSTVAEQYPEQALQPFITDVLTHMALHRQADAETLVGILSPKYGDPQTVADQLVLLAELDYVDIEETMDGWKFMVKYDVSSDVHEMLDKYQFPLPMLVHPKRLTRNFDTGYLTILNPVILNGSDYFDDKDVCLDHLNRMNHVALEVNMEVVRSQEGKFISPTREDDEDFKDFQKRQKQAVKFYETTVDVMNTLNALGGEFYLTHRFDRRGRCYASGYHINTQGDDYRKAMLVLHRKEKLDAE
jgi:hypothetical protein